MLKIQNAMSEKMGMLVAYISNSFFLIGIAFYFGWKLTTALMTAFPVVGLVVSFNSAVSSRMTEKEQKSYAEAGSVAEEVLGNIKTVQAFGGQNKEIMRYDEKILKAKKTAVRKYLLCGLGNGLSWCSYYMNFAFAYWYGTHLVLKSRESGDGLYGPDNLLVVRKQLAWSLNR
jgi:ATP-binding cassette subfamily B (MDR/TAP) protein 1